MAIQRLDLSIANWSVTIPTSEVVPLGLRGRTIAAEIPGCIHLDLIRAGLIQHPNIGFAELDNLWIGECDWAYLARFRVDDELLRHGGIELECDGLDTVCELSLNGRAIGRAANMFHAHRFDIRNELRAGENELAIRFLSPMRHIREEETRLGARPVNGDWDPYIFIRKSACNFGWDWGPKVATAGVWRPLRIVAWSGARISRVQLTVERHRENSEAWSATATVGVRRRVSGESAAACELVGRVHQAGATVSMSRVAIAPDTDKSVLRVDVVWPSLWWPRGYGKQPRYDLELTLQDRDGAVLDQTTRRFGFRTIRLSTQPDEIGAEFVLHVNDRPIFCKGANWIPDSLFPAEVTQARYLQRIRQAVDANMNMLRVWGGGIYESDSFYDACDEYGVLVWQDFMFACAMYPEESPLRALVVAEAEYAVSRISHHPCVALWCGGNECVWAHESWGFGQRLRSGQSWGSAYYYDELPQAVCDARIPYWPNSPYSGATTIPANDEHFGNRHVWDTWGEGYRQTVPRFCSEFGHQSPPNYATLREALPELELQLGSRAMEHRQRASGGNAVRYDQPLAEWFRSPRDFDEWHFAAQLLAARSVATGIEWWRAHQPRCMGVLFWQLNDVWAGHSWSAVDVAGRRKLLWYAARRAFAPRLLTIQPMDGQLRLVLVNDTDDEWTASALVRRVDFDGRVLGEASYSCDVARRGVHLTGDLASQVGGAERKTREVIVADCDGLRATWYFAQDRELDYPQPQFAGEIERNGAECRVRITAQTLLRDVCFQFDRVWPSAEMSDQLITLLPGESASFSLTGDIPPSAEIYRRPLMWCAN